MSPPHCNRLRAFDWIECCWVLLLMGILIITTTTTTTTAWSLGNGYHGPSFPVLTTRRHVLQQGTADWCCAILLGSCCSSGFVQPPPAIAATATTTTTTADLKEEYRQGTAALGNMDDDAPVPREAYQKLASGVIYADVRPGRPGGATVQENSRVNLQWVLRRSNGYFVDSSQVQDSIPFIFTVGDGTAIAGLDEGVRTMKEGGVRRILIPPSLAYVQGLEDGKPGPLPAGYGPRQQMRRVQTIRKDVPGEYIFLEVQATRVR